jgi:hypothetical protein
MKLVFEGEECLFISIKDFAQEQELPENFRVSYFEPKDFQGLAAIDKAGSEMKELRQSLLDAVPDALSIAELLTFSDKIQAIFRAGLYAINEIIHLKPEEVEFAVAGFADVLRNWAYALIRGQSSGEVPSFTAIYYQWLSDTARISQNSHDYEHDGAVWQVQMVNHAYGRVGLRVDTGDKIYYLADSIYACPAEGYMTVLMADLGALIQGRVMSNE